MASDPWLQGPERIYIGGGSSGGHLCGVTLITDWEKDFGVPSTIVKGVFRRPLTASSSLSASGAIADAKAVLAA
jgi:hypothetical protein